MTVCWWRTCYLLSHQVCAVLCRRPLLVRPPLPRYRPFAPPRDAAWPSLKPLRKRSQEPKTKATSLHSLTLARKCAGEPRGKRRTREPLPTVSCLCFSFSADEPTSRRRGDDLFGDPAFPLCKSETSPRTHPTYDSSSLKAQHSRQRRTTVMQG